MPLGLCVPHLEDAAGGRVGVSLHKRRAGLSKREGINYRRIFRKDFEVFASSGGRVPQ